MSDTHTVPNGAANTHKPGAELPSQDWQHVAPAWMRKLGVRSWLILGFAGVVALVAWGVTLSASIVGPLLIAVILGILFSPLVDWMERYRIPRGAGAGIAMLLILGVLAGVVVIVEKSVVSQWPLIVKQVTAGSESLKAWIATLNLPKGTADSIDKSVRTAVPQASGKAASSLLGGISSTAAVLFGGFLAFYMLFFTLKDDALLARFVGRHLGLPVELGMQIIEDSATAIRQYFKGTTVLALITTVATMIGLWIIHVPLVVAIGIVTFVMSYIPFFGAIVSSVFAVVIALATGGVTMAIYALIVVLLAQNVLQSVVQSWAIGSALDLHPLVVLIATMLGATFAGLIGGMLGAPIAAISVKTVNRVRDARLDGESWAASAEPPPVPTS